MSTSATPRRRKSADAKSSRTVKTSCSLDAATHARLCAAASLGNVSIAEFLESAVREALKGVVVIDRRFKVGDLGESLPGEDLAAPLRVASEEEAA